MIPPSAWTWSYVLKCDPSLSWILYVNERVKLNMLNYLLDKLKAVRSPNSMSHRGGESPPKMYITPSTRAPAWSIRGDGMGPVHCSSVHFRVEMLNDQVSLNSCRSPRPPNLQNIIMRGEGMGKRDTNMMIRSPVVTETWPDLGRGFSFPGAGSYDSQKGFDLTIGKSGQNGSGKRGANVQQFKSNAQISFINKRLSAVRPPKTKSLEPTKVMV
jgi:hypothetical protein